MAENWTPIIGDERERVRNLVFLEFLNNVRRLVDSYRAELAFCKFIGLSDNRPMLRNSRLFFPLVLLLSQ